MATTSFIKLHLGNWRSFASVDVRLQNRVFIIGPNAAGKSNLLDAFRFLHDLVALGGGFEEAITRRGGVSKLRSLAARRYPEVVVGVALGDPVQERPEWEYEIAFTQDNRQRPVIKREIVNSRQRILRRPIPKTPPTPSACVRAILNKSMSIGTSDRSLTFSAL